MTEEVPLPRLIWDPSTESFSSTRERKRVKLSSPPFSSDPVFSSDEDPSAENYTQERRKKKFRGPWYHQRPILETAHHELDQHDPQRKTKRSFERHFDSGVFMGSDGTDVDDDAVEDNLIERVSVPTLLPWRPSRATQTAKELSPEEWVQDKIHQCLEDGNQTIDLS